MRAGFLVALLSMIAASGCEQPAATLQPAASPQATPAPPAEAVTASQPSPDQYGGAGQYAAQAGQAAANPSDPGTYAPAGSPPTNPANPALAPTPTAPPTAGQAPTLEKAEAGVGVRGDSLGQGIYSTPARAYFQVRERAAFLQVDQALNLFRGLEGRLPKNHDEFMEKVIRANNIQLPELAPGSTYLWDPEKGELMVQRQQ